MHKESQDKNQSFVGNITDRSIFSDENTVEMIFKEPITYYSIDCYETQFSSKLNKSKINSDNDITKYKLQSFFNNKQIFFSKSLHNLKSEFLDKFKNVITLNKFKSIYEKFKKNDLYKFMKTYLCSEEYLKEINKFRKLKRLISEIERPIMKSAMKILKISNFGSKNFIYFNLKFLLQTYKLRI